MARDRPPPPERLQKALVKTASTEAGGAAPERRNHLPIDALPSHIQAVLDLYSCDSTIKEPLAKAGDLALYISAHILVKARVPGEVFILPQCKMHWARVNVVGDILTTPAEKWL